MKNVIIRYGVYSSIVMIVLFSITDIFLGHDYELSEQLGYASILLCMIFVFLGIRQYREEVGGGEITFMQSLKVGLMIVAFPSIVFGLFNVIYVTMINPDFMENFYQHNLANLKAELSAEDFAIKSAELESQKEMFMNPFMNFLVMGMTVFLIGVVISVLSSFALKKK